MDETAERRQLIKLRDKAYQYLARREHSLYELRNKLLRFDEMDHLDQLLETLVAENSQSDERFAAHLARVRYAAGKGPMVLQQEFSQHRIDPVIVEQVMAEYEDHWLERAQQIRQKKFGKKQPLSYHEWAKQARFLQQRGFTAEHIPSFKD